MNSLKNILKLSFSALMMMLAISSCKKEGGAYNYQNKVNVYEGNVYDYLVKNKAGQFDSLLVALDRVTWMKDTLKTAKAITVFGLTNRSFDLAFKNVNIIREQQNKAPMNLQTVDANELAILLDRYVVAKKLTTDSLRFADGAILYTARLGYTMNAMDKSSNASGLVNGGPASVTYSDTKNSQYIKDWKGTTTQAVNIITANAVLHIVASTHEFGFAEFSTRMNK